MSDQKEKLIFDAAYQPQVRTARNTQSLMLDVIISLMPAFAVAVWQFGAQALVPVISAVAACVLFELVYAKLMKKVCRISDLSACVTGLLLGLTLPAGAPWWVAVIGSFFAIVVVKQLYGGIGKNFLNPALAGRAFLLASYVIILNTYSVPKSLQGVDAVSSATPLSYLYGGLELPSYFTVKNLFLGSIPGSMGEISALAILIGLAYLLIRRVISWRIPVSFIGTTALLTLIFGRSGYSNFDWMLLNLLSGSVLFGAVFMATDYVTSPVTAGGQLLYGFGCGALVVLIRYFGGYPEGTTYAILIMNLCSWAIDKAFHRKPFGTVKSDKSKGKEADA